MRRTLLASGTLLLLLGLLLGTIIERFASPSIASDAHVAGVQHGMLLMILGLAWRHADLAKLAVTCVSLNIIGLYGIWSAFLIGAMIGDPYPSATTTTYVIFVASSWFLICGVAIFLHGLWRHRED